MKLELTDDQIAVGQGVKRGWTTLRQTASQSRGYGSIQVQNLSLASTRSSLIRGAACQWRQLSFEGER